MSTTVVQQETATTDGSRINNTNSTVKKTIALILGLPIVLGLMLWAFLAPTFSSGPDGVPVAVAGPEPVVEKLRAQAEQQEEHPDFIAVSSQDEAEDMVRNRDAVGAIAVGQGGATVYTASGNGAPYVQMLNGLAQNMQATGMPVETKDLAPTTEDDPQAQGLALLGLPLAFGGVISGMLATMLLRGHKWSKAAVIAGVATLGAGVAVWMLHGIYGTLSGSVGMEWLAIALGIAATSAVTAGLGALFGVPGAGLGAVLTIFVANPLSGLATGPWFLSAGWSTLGQLMPIGATGYLVRSLSFFDGADARRSWIVLCSWIVVGLILLAFDRSKEKAA